MNLSCLMQVHTGKATVTVLCRLGVFTYSTIFKVYLVLLVFDELDPWYSL